MSISIDPAVTPVATTSSHGSGNSGRAPQVLPARAVEWQVMLSVTVTTHNDSEAARAGPGATGTGNLLIRDARAPLHCWAQLRPFCAAPQSLHKVKRKVENLELELMLKNIWER